MLEPPKSRPGFQGDSGTDETMGNQQRKTVGLDFAAGIITGEGSFVLSAHRVRKNRLRVKPQFYMQMNDAVTVQLVAAALGEHGVPIWLGYSERRGCMILQVAGLKRMQKLVLLLLPYLTGQKYEAANLVGEYIASRQEKPPQAPYSEREIGLVHKLRSVNGVGGKHVNRLSPETIIDSQSNRYKRNGETTNGTAQRPHAGGDF